MQEFIQIAAKELGLAEDVSKKATQGVLSLVFQKADKADIDQLSAKVPGLEGFLATGAGPGTQGQGGALGGLASAASGLLGNKAGGLLKSIGSLSDLGLSSQKLAPFVGLLVNFLRNKAGGDLVDRLLSQVPELAKLVGQPTR